MLGVMKLFPVPILEPPVEFSNQLITPFEEDAVIVALPFPHMLAELTELMVGALPTDAVTEVLKDVQPLLLTSA